MSKDLARRIAKLFKVDDLGRVEVLGTYNVSPASFIKVFREGFEHKKTYGLFESDFAEGTAHAEYVIEKHSKMKVKRFIKPLEEDSESDGCAAVDDFWFIYLAELE
jgi:hypothetical protein